MLMIIRETPNNPLTDGINIINNINPAYDVFTMAFRCTIISTELHAY